MVPVTRRALAFAALVLALGATPACAPAGPAPPPDAASREVVLILGAPAVNLNPYTPVMSARRLGALVFRGLFALDEDGMPVPDLALAVPTRANAGMSEDGLRVTYSLDPAARWHDGEPVTAADVVFTWGLLESGALADGPSAAMDSVAGVRAVDDHTVQLTLSRPDAATAWRLVPYVLPEHLLAGSADLLSDPYWYRPVGAGPYSVSETRAGASATLERVYGEGPARFAVRFVEDPAVARGLWDDAGPAVWMDPPVTGAGAEEYLEAAGTVWRAFVFNVAPGRVMADPAVRDAFAQVTSSVAPVGPLGTAPEAASGPYGAAWAPEPPDTGATNESLPGASPPVRFVVPGIEPQEGERFESILAGWRSLGAEIEQDIEGEPAFRAGYPGGGSIWTGDYDVAWTELVVGHPFGWAWPFAAGDIPAADRPLGLNISRVDDDELEAARAAMADAGDPRELREAAARAWERVEALHLVHLDGPLPTATLSRAVQGVTPHPVPTEALRGATLWSVGGSEDG